MSDVASELVSVVADTMSEYDKQLTCCLTELGWMVYTLKSSDEIDKKTYEIDRIFKLMSELTKKVC